MKTKHTSGQWIKGRGTSSRDWMKVFCNGKEIAQVKELSKKGHRKATDFDEEGANVHLIAHAPELLQMVFDLKNCVKRLCEDNLSQFDRDREAQWIGNAHEMLLSINPDYYTNANSHTPKTNQQ